MSENMNENTKFKVGDEVMIVASPWQLHSIYLYESEINDSVNDVYEIIAINDTCVLRRGMSNEIHLPIAIKSKTKDYPSDRNPWYVRPEYLKLVTPIGAQLEFSFMQEK